MIVYQGYGQGADLAALERLNALSLGGFKPDLTVLLDIPVVEGLWRAGSNRYERMGTALSRASSRGLPRPRPRRARALCGGRCEAGPRNGGRAILEIVAARLPVSFDG